jgi:hypothetical protein
MVIPIVDAAAGKKEWDEAIARGAGDVVQDLAVSALASSAYVAFFGSNPVGWSAVAVGALLLLGLRAFTSVAFLKTFPSVFAKNKEDFVFMLSSHSPTSFGRPKYSSLLLFTLFSSPKRANNILRHRPFLNAHGLNSLHLSFLTR